VLKESSILQAVIRDRNMTGSWPYYIEIYELIAKGKETTW